MTLMRTKTLKTLLLLLVPFCFSFAQISSTTPFEQEIATVFTPKDGLPEIAFTGLQIDKSGNILAISDQGIYKYNGKQWKLNSKAGSLKKEMPLGMGILAKATFNQQEYIGKKGGLFVREGKKGKWKEVFPTDGIYNWKLSDVAVLLTDSKGRLWFGSNQGVGFLQNGRWTLFTGREGLPFKYFTSGAVGKNGDVWFGTKKGAIRADGERFHYRMSRRWLPDDYINAILVEKNGTTWFATNKGVSRIVFQSMTMEEKANLFTQQVESRHTRMGFIAQNHLNVRFDSSSWEPAISDNDGMYTSKYGAAQAFRYAVTGSEEAKQIAKRSFDACKSLVDITHEKGFPARVIVPIDWHEPLNEQYDHAYNMRAQKRDPFWKDIIPRFVTSEDGKYLWKCDTSSDELAGHYFFYGVYYDLVADTEEEKNQVAEVVGDITDHLIRNGFFLKDHDGTSTRWGNFSPEFCNSVWGWDQRGLNSMMMLSFLNVAHHVTGDKKYMDTAKMLRDEHNYHINAMLAKMYYPPEDVVPWDNNLALMSFYGLLNYEEDPELIMMYRESLEFAWMHISKQKNAFWNVLYASPAQKFNTMVDSGIYSSGKYFQYAPPYSEFTAKEFYKTDFKIDDTMETLLKLPLDLIGYRMDNRHRLDVIFDPTPGQNDNEGWQPQKMQSSEAVFGIDVDKLPKMGWHYDTRALPIDERCHVRLDRDAFVLDAIEGDGYTEHEGTMYLLPYYMARYHGLIK